MSDIEVSVDGVQLLLISVRVDDHVVKHGFLGPLIHLAVGFPDLQVQARHLDPSLVQVFGILCEKLRTLRLTLGSSWWPPAVLYNCVMFRGLKAPMSYWVATGPCYL